MKITVGDMKDMLKDCPDDMELYFNGLDFYRLKQRDEKILQVEFNQLVYEDKETGEVKIDNLK
ncbi:MAG: hypothetical protein A6F72_08850 [Cycloclasticus sp. symbiont of Poecilosclerida sp. N]|nr:MAG: hypothetical protein A6F72_08850 [Cycloclasticus sp. symbiont of Poecilosclerida sp. N]